MADYPECPRCKDIYGNKKGHIKEPKILNCGDSICKECLEDLIKDKNEEFFSCPTCGDKIKNKHDSWDVLLKLANLKSTPYRLGKGKEISDKELFQDIERVWIKLGRQPTITDIRNGEFNFSQNTFTRRFGGWRKTLEAFVYYINNNTDDSEILRDNRLSIHANGCLFFDL